MSKKAAPTAAVGIDVAKEHCDVCFLDEAEDSSHQGHYPEEKYKALVKKIVKAKPRIVVLEATGGCEREPAGLLVAAGAPLRIVSPLRARQFANSIGLLGKAAAKSVKKMLTVLDDEIAAIDQLLDAAIKDDDEFRHKEEILTSVPGVGDQTARTLLGSMPELGQINRAEAAALAGLAPFASDSGKQRGKRVIRGGRFHIRRCLCMAAVSASKHTPRFKQLHQRLVAAGNTKKARTDCVYEKAPFATQCIA